MATLTIRRLDDAAYARLRAQAQANKRSLEAEARMILENEARPAGDVVGDLMAFNAEMTLKHGLLPDSLDLIRAQRDDK
ncbi:MAG: hypothetical protein CFE37_09090 [Alphaproteobacteria bacterium PA4]|nr:MAG: hypothetical protein CFE37_09090 [Alphaproteobacteria bacterium PA4]